MEETKASRRLRPRTKKGWICTGGIFLAVVAASVGAGILLHHPSPLPAPIGRQITGFTPYFAQPLPNGFTFDQAHITYAHNILFIRFTTTSGHMITMSEQRLPPGLSFDALQGEGSEIDGGPGPAAVSNIEDRTVASVMTADHKTLILLNSDNASKDEMTMLVQALHPLH